jgi:acyl carrier protein
MSAEAALPMDLMAKVRAIIADHLAQDIDAIAPESRIIADLGADSLDVAELVTILEKSFRTKVPDALVRRLVTVTDVVALVARLTAEGGAALVGTAATGPVPSAGGA